MQEATSGWWFCRTSPRISPCSAHGHFVQNLHMFSYNSFQICIILPWGRWRKNPCTSVCWMFFNMVLHHAYTAHLPFPPLLLWSFRTCRSLRLDLLRLVDPRVRCQFQKVGQKNSWTLISTYVLLPIGTLGINLISFLGSLKGMPHEALPQHHRKGKLTYTVTSAETGAKVEVHLKGKAFRVIKVGTRNGFSDLRTLGSNFEFVAFQFSLLASRILHDLGL